MVGWSESHVSEGLGCVMLENVHKVLHGDVLQVVRLPSCQVSESLVPRASPFFTAFTSNVQAT